MKIAVIGGGAAGLVAAIKAAELGAEVTVLERTERVGKKILATGNGRCNMTNIYIETENYHGENPKFVISALKRFGAEAALDFFGELGIVPRTEDNGKVYPYSNQASSVLDVLRMRLDLLGVKIITSFDVSEIIPVKNGFTVKSYTGDAVKCGKVIVAAGGKASPVLGSNGSGYEILKKLGHTVTELFPSLVQLKTDISFTKGLKGVKFDGTASLRRDGKTVKSASGEILFTEYGLSGPPLFELSRTAAENLLKNKQVTVSLDLMPSFTEETVRDMLAQRADFGADKLLENYFTGMLNKRLGQALLKSCGISPLSGKCSSLSAGNFKRLAKKIKDWEFDVYGTMPWANAQVTAGGIRTDEVKPSTMESRIIKGLYIAGELLDIDGDCGGYNLQWAWSSGAVAGICAAGGDDRLC